MNFRPSPAHLKQTWCSLVHWQDLALDDACSNRKSLIWVAIIWHNLCRSCSKLFFVWVNFCSC